MLVHWQQHVRQEVKRAMSRCEVRLPEDQINHPSDQAVKIKGDNRTPSVFSGKIYIFTFKTSLNISQTKSKVESLELEVEPRRGRESHIARERKREWERERERESTQANDTRGGGIEKSEIQELSPVFCPYYVRSWMLVYPFQLRVVFLTLQIEYRYNYTLPRT